MKTLPLGTSDQNTTRLAYGCWRLAEAGPEAAKATILAAYEAGYRCFDHADIYGDGQSEVLFGKVLRDAPELREHLLIASKCGICKQGIPETSSPYRYNFKQEHIIQSCEGSLRRLGIDCLDLYQLHRPDYLGEPEEVAGAMDKLTQAGKVRGFGLSNFRPSQVSLFRTLGSLTILTHQVEISLAQLDRLEDGTLDQCQELRITPMAWSPLGGGLLGAGASRLLTHQRSYETRSVTETLDEIATQRGVTRTVIALAWLIRHPAGIVPILGTTHPDRIRQAARACDLNLSHEEWYRLLTAARSRPLP